MSEINIPIEPNKGIITATVQQHTITGPQGKQGDDGLSAYELAVEQGFTGTLDEWLETLVGPQGNTGPIGEQGIQGNIGPQGIKGETGAQGIKGDTGSTGPQGIQGDRGAEGQQGERGATGLQGIQGLQGPQGAKGDTGAQGPIGLTGLQGIKGDSFDPEDLDRINETLEELQADIDDNAINIAANKTAITGLQSEATAKWIILNATETRSKNNETNITSLQSIIGSLNEVLEARLNGE